MLSETWVDAISAEQYGISSLHIWYQISWVSLRKILIRLHKRVIPGCIMIPEWMKSVSLTHTEFAPPPPARKDFVKKTIDSIISFFQEAMTTEEISSRRGLLQSLDPRVKLISMLSLIFAISMTRNLEIIALFYLATLVLAYLSSISIAFFIKRVWLFIPIFTGVIAIPMTLNIFLPGDVLLPLVDLGRGAHIGPLAIPESIYITSQGSRAAVLFTLRVAACVSAVVLLFLTTPQKVLFKSLRSIGVPKVYVLTLEMANRYIFLFMEMIRDLYIAKRSRTIKSRGTLAEQRWVGGRIGYMLIKALDMSEKVHMAMISRGFSGDVRLSYEFAMRSRDYIALGVSVVISILLLTRGIANA
ncbi:MAG: cobalt ECF transporter T component CbiQ [Methanothrix sp.]|uniref:cobalt ECF transporter T component CbiQ n=1 Tax=Methanothrix sp. TaxID=90426 RepID=UPI0025EA6810|nr:cobalt ECF transporter T component CbiQ [Methanothrix sp.]MCQ8903433.1 cobalt ECF transporter T component CbiQ [Methanothrix sp.]